MYYKLIHYRRHHIIKMKKLFLLISLLCHFIGHSQSYEWWNAKHNWDGVTHWSKYIILSPAYLGPNALPVQECRDGQTTKNVEFDMSFDIHFSTGDFTSNLFMKLYIPLFSDRVGLQLSMVPVEYYKMDTLTRDIRRVRDEIPEGYSVGDLHIGTFIQIVKDHEKLPDVMLTINIKTASGGKLGAARYTDSPGYYFDVSIGKDFTLSKSFLNSIRPYIQLGFYVWQTNLDGYYQNDAFLYGLGIKLKTHNLEINNYLGGYIGYIDNGDKPMIYRLILETIKFPVLNYKIMFQQGLNDFEYSTFRVGFKINFTSLIERNRK